MYDLTLSLHSNVLIELAKRGEAAMEKTCYMASLSRDSKLFLKSKWDGKKYFAKTSSKYLKLYGAMSRQGTLMCSQGNKNSPYTSMLSALGVEHVHAKDERYDLIHLQHKTIDYMEALDMFEVSEESSGIEMYERILNYTCMFAVCKDDVAKLVTSYGGGAVAELKLNKYDLSNIQLVLEDARQEAQLAYSLVDNPSFISHVCKRCNTLAGEVQIDVKISNKQYSWSQLKKGTIVQWHEEVRVGKNEYKKTSFRLKFS